MSRLLAELYKFACGIAVYGNVDQLLPRFQCGLLFLIGEFGFLYEALPACLQKKKKDPSKNITSKRHFGLGLIIVWKSLISFRFIPTSVEFYLSAAIPGNGSAVPRDCSQVQVLNWEDVNSSTFLYG